MLLASSRRFARGAAVLCLVAACQAAPASFAPPPPSDAGADAAAFGLAFDPTSSPCPNGQDLCISPGQSIDLGVTLTGPDAVVSFALEGDYSDASLGQGAAATNGGHAHVTLRAPSTAATFTVRASAPGASDARLAVSVSATGYATVNVLPSYSGRRAVPALTASVFVKARCADLAKAALHDGDLAVTARPGAPLEIANVPADSHVAVQVRVASYASGCADVASLVPNVETDVPVQLFDKPMALDLTDLESKFTFEPDTSGTAGWSSMIDGAIADAENAFVPATAASEGSALLDAMRAAVPSADQAAFDAARTSGQWDTRATTWLGQAPPTLKDRVSAWLAQGKPYDLGTLAAHLGPGETTGTTTIALETYAGFDAAAAGLAVDNAKAPFTWTADANDLVHLAGTVHLAPSALVARSADARAAAAVTGATDVAGALARQIDCAGLASALVGSGESYPSCDVTCTAALCASGLAAMWRAAAGASVATGGEVLVQITASAQASVGAQAEPLDFSGKWVGQVGRASATTFPMQGAASGRNVNVPH